MIRGASKNHNAVTVVTDTKQYAQVIAVRGVTRTIWRYSYNFIIRAT